MTSRPPYVVLQLLAQLREIDPEMQTTMYVLDEIEVHVAPQHREAAQKVIDAWRFSFGDARMRPATVWLSPKQGQIALHVEVKANYPSQWSATGKVVAMAEPYHPLRHVARVEWYGEQRRLSWERPIDLEKLSKEGGNK
jgi:hypothetical protein